MKTCALLACVIVTMLAASVFAERPVNNTRGKTTTGHVGDALEYIIPGAALGVAVWQRDTDGMWQFGKGLAATLATSYLLKHTISKQRPDRRDHDSFPSSHTSASVHAAAFVQERYGWKLGLPAYIASAYVGYSRVYDDRHDEEDVLAGAVIGFVAARYFTTSMAGVSVTPAVSADFVGLRFSRTLGGR